MKLLRLGAPGAERPADDGCTYDLTGLSGDIDGPALATGGVRSGQLTLAKHTNGTNS
ncbi:hypothetical protein [Streptomyces chengmaiensis]|uniref:hypothetical protein n=1 Tax=Streptomyces chengmaiensis TaxID=3040919 RepID=UPI0037D9F949